MSPEEANALIVAAAMLDPRMKRTNPEDQADMAEAWARILTIGGVDVADAQAAIDRHYLTERDPIMPADIVRLVGEVEEVAPVHDLDPEWLAETKRTALAEFGYTPEEYDADPKVQADVAARWAAREIEERERADAE